MITDTIHDIALLFKRVFGIRQTSVSLLAESLWHYNTSTWLERITANGILFEYEVKH